MMYAVKAINHLTADLLADIVVKRKSCVDKKFKILYDICTLGNFLLVDLIVQDHRKPTLKQCSAYLPRALLECIMVSYQIKISHHTDIRS